MKADVHFTIKNEGKNGRINERNQHTDMMKRILYKDNQKEKRETSHSNWRQIKMISGRKANEREPVKKTI